jgi:hypothetical protein
MAIGELQPEIVAAGGPFLPDGLCGLYRRAGRHSFPVLPFLRDGRRRSGENGGETTSRHVWRPEAVRRLILLSVLALGLSAVVGRADEALPPPRVIAEPPPLVVFNPQWGRINYHAVWENYAVDRFGYFRPRVVLTPDGAFYYYNGRPFRWAYSRPLEWMPYANDD